MSKDAVYTNDQPQEKAALYSSTTPLSTNSYHHDGYSSQYQYQHVNQDASLSDPGPKLPHTARDRFRALTGWRLSVLLGLLCTLFVLIANIGILVWTYSRLKIKNGSAIAWAGSSNDLKNVSLWTHLAVNILSSLLLAASNNAMQCLVAPTRLEVGKAHASRQWMQIGVLGIHNLNKIGAPRVVIWFLLLLSSLPLHLLYNSIIYDTLGSNEYVYAFVTPEFFAGGTWDPSFWDFGGNFTSFSDYQKTPNNLVRVENKACIEIYATNYVSQYGDVIAVTDGHSYGNESCVQGMQAVSLFPGISPRNSVSNWYYSYSIPANSPMTPQTAISYADDWVYRSYNFTSSDYDFPHVQYCMVNPKSTQSYIEINPGILAGVIVCNFVKLICFVLTLVYAFRDHEPLITTGDAVDSFLNTPEPSTVGNSVLTAQDVKNGSWQTGRASKAWQGKRHFWFSAASVKRWICLSILTALFWVLGIVLLIVGIHNFDSGDHTKGLANVPFAYLSALGFGVPQPQTTLATPNLNGVTLNFNSITKNIIISNLPQLILSLTYFMYNGTWTCMLTMSEWTSYASSASNRAKALRVSRPKGQQRSTLYLQLPYQYSILLLAAAALLHWFLSRSIFITRINSHGLEQYNFADDQDKIVDAIGWSPVPLICTLVLAFAMMLVLWANGFRRYNARMPLAAINSMGISAACHRRAGETVEVRMHKIAFGDVGIPDGVSEGPGHATFTADLANVCSLIKDKEYI